MRLYRCLKETYRSDRRPEGLAGVDFTDCPYTATLYAFGRRGQVLRGRQNTGVQAQRKTVPRWTQRFLEGRRETQDVCRAWIEL